MDDFTGAFNGRHVTVISSVGGAQEHTDTGTIVAMTEHWLQLAKDNGEMLIFPHASVRVMKLLDVEPSLTATKEDAMPASRPRLARDDAPL